MSGRTEMSVGCWSNVDRTHSHTHSLDDDADTPITSMTVAHHQRYVQHRAQLSSATDIEATFILTYTSSALLTFFLLLSDRTYWHCKHVKCSWSNFCYVQHSKIDKFSLHYITVHCWWLKHCKLQAAAECYLLPKICWQYFPQQLHILSEILQA